MLHVNRKKSKKMDLFKKTKTLCPVGSHHVVYWLLKKGHSVKIVVSNHEKDGAQTVHPVMQCLSFVSVLHHSTWSKRVALRYSLVLVTCRSIMWFWYIFPFKTWAPVLTAFSTSLVDSSRCSHRKVIDFPSPAFIKTTLRGNIKENNLPSKIRSTEARKIENQ